MKKIIQSLLLILGIYQLNAQDIHMSHIHASPLHLNPAMAGMFDGDIRLIADFRSQWHAVTTDYRTMYASMDAKTRTMFKRNSAVAFGLEMFSDRAGDLDFRTYGGYYTMSMLQTLDGYRGRKMISAAIKFGVLGNSFNINNTNEVVEQENFIGSNYANDNILYTDWQLGIGWFHELKKQKHTYYLGFAAAHLNEPKIDFNLIDQAQEENGRFLHRKFTFHGGGDFTLSKAMTLMPSAIYVDQGPNKEILMGTFWKYRSLQKHLKKKNIAMYIGTWARWHFEFDGITGFDALIAAARFNYKTTSFTFSYDINLSSLSMASAGRGGPEISLVHIVEMKNKKKRKVRCPALDW